MNFIDEHRLPCWVYLLKDKSKVKEIFKVSYTMLETQFQETIKVFGSDDGREYLNEVLELFFKKRNNTSSPIQIHYNK